MKHKVVGLISTMAPDETWAQEVIDRVSNRHDEVKKIIEDMGFEVLDEGPIHRSYSEMTTAGRNLGYRGINALVLFVGTWTYSNCAVAAAMEANVPVIIIGDAVPGTCGLVGSAIARGGMSEYGIHANLIYGPLSENKIRSKIKTKLNAACAAKGLKGQVLGLGGGRSMGMVTAVLDPNEVKKKFGVEIDSFEQSEVIELAEKIPDEQAEVFYNWMEKTFGNIVAKKIAVMKQIKLYLALKSFCEKKKYDFVAVKCLPELSSYYTTFCLAHAILGDAADHNGAKDRFVLACEADLNAALTMQMLKMMQDGPVLFTDLTQYDFEADVLTTCNCGSQPTDFAGSKKDVIWEREGVHEHCWKYGGTCPQHVAKAGLATMARLSRNNGQYEMLITEAEVVDMPREKLKETIWERPHTFVKLHCDKDKFFESVRSNHIHLVYGDYKEALIEACEILDIKPIVVE